MHKGPYFRNSTQILVRFQNSTDSAIEEALMEFDSANATDVGAILADATTDYIVFDYFKVGYYEGDDYFFPMGYMNGKKDGVDLSAWSLNWCGTGVEYKQLDPGKYTIEIVKIEGDSPWPYQIRFVDWNVALLSCGELFWENFQSDLEIKMERTYLCPAFERRSVRLGVRTRPFHG